jgi:hypothetical protein
MSYKIILSDDAVERLDALPIWLREPVQAHLSRLAESPTTLSRTIVSPPYPPVGGMMSEFNWGPADNTLHHFVIFFRYGRDRTSLIISSIGHTALKVEGSD